MWNSLGKNHVEGQVAFTLNLGGKGLGYLLLMYQLRATVCYFMQLNFLKLFRVDVVVYW